MGSVVHNRLHVVSSNNWLLIGSIGVQHFRDSQNNSFLKGSIGVLHSKGLSNNFFLKGSQGVLHSEDFDKLHVAFPDVLTDTLNIEGIAPFFSANFFLLPITYDNYKL